MNSSHAFAEYTGVSISNPNILDIYNIIKFDEWAPIKRPLWAPISAPNILTTHTYPDINVITKRLAETKIILITFDKSELLEIVGNGVYKNMLDNKKSPVDDMLKRWWNLVHNKPMIPIHLLSEDELREGIKKIIYLKHMTMTYSLNRNANRNGKFMNKVNTNSQMLVIPYKELFDTTTTIARLEQFTGTTANEVLVDNYMKYVTGRTKFIEKNMPWLLKENSNN